MLRRIVLALALTAVLFLTGCPLPLTSTLSPDLVLMLGVFGPAQGVTTVRGALGGAIDVPVLIADQTGRAALGSYDVAFTLSADADITTTGDNIDAGTMSVSAGTQTVVSIAVPVSAVAAVYTLFGQMTAADAADNNNLSSVSVDINASNSPDLEIAVGSAPAWADPETGITVGYAVSNNGYAKVAAGTAFTVEFTANLSGIDEVLGQEVITLDADLYPSEQDTRQLTVTLPTLTQMATDLGTTTTAVDDYNVGITARVDVNNDVVEIVEGGTDGFVVVSGNRKPDLDMNNIVLPNDFVGAKVGNPVLLTLEVRNVGAAATGEYGIDLYIDFGGDGNFDTGVDTMLHQWAQADTPVVPYDLSGNGNDVVYLTLPADVVYPAGTPPGAYDIRAEIITAIDEYSTGNNTATEPSVSFVDQIYNLSMKTMSSSLATSIDDAVGGTIPLSYTLKNDGEDSVPAGFDVAFYASDDSNLSTGGDILVGTDTVTAAVAAGGILSGSFTATMPPASGAAFYTVYWVIDSGGAVTESNEGDNQPAQPEECYVFPLVSDGATDFDTRLLAFKPLGSEAVSQDLKVWLYDTIWSSSTDGTGSATNPGDLYKDKNRTLTTGSTAGIRMSNTTSIDDQNVTFRLVPDYVRDLPMDMIPPRLAGQDPYEANDTTGDAFALSGSTNPLYGFVTIWLDDASGDLDDYFTFVVP